MQTRLLAPVMLLLLALTPIHSAPAPGKTHTVLIKGFRFEPERLEVMAGDTVVWKNQDIVPHTATAKKVFDSKQIDAASSWSVVVKQKGTFPYICTFHPTMKAELVVK